MANITTDYFWSESRYNYTFYADSGDLAGIEGQIYVRVYAGLEENNMDEMLGKSVKILNITVTEME